mmetsp:Transcript_93895/g.249287  ORF Transcript_93895/g.249287 Transcript_93895/m.249287 type:complete len:234 (-) Transcript_93895:281-982(-)
MHLFGVGLPPQLLPGAHVQNLHRALAGRGGEAEVDLPVGPAARAPERVHVLVVARRVPELLAIYGRKTVHGPADVIEDDGVVPVAGCQVHGGVLGANAVLGKLASGTAVLVAHAVAPAHGAVTLAHADNFGATIRPQSSRGVDNEVVKGRGRVRVPRQLLGDPRLPNQPAGVLVVGLGQAIPRGGVQHIALHGRVLHRRKAGLHCPSEPPELVVRLQHSLVAAGVDVEVLVDG